MLTVDFEWIHVWGANTFFPSSPWHGIKVLWKIMGSQLTNKTKKKEWHVYVSWPSSDSTRILYEHGMRVNKNIMNKSIKHYTAMPWVAAWYPTRNKSTWFIRAQTWSECFFFFFLPLAKHGGYGSTSSEGIHHIQLLGKTVGGIYANLKSAWLEQNRLLMGSTCRTFFFLMYSSFAK